jgi:hypothetical protein
VDGRLALDYQIFLKRGGWGAYKRPFFCYNYFMLSWSNKRQLMYVGGVLLCVALLVFGVFFKSIFKSSTCTDSKQNGDETGVDCGGSCRIMCNADVLKPVVLWAKVFNISGDVYTAVAYVQNPNINVKNSKVGYRFKIYDEHDVWVATKEGQTSIPKNKKFAIFETGFLIRSGKPKTAELEFTSFGPWEKDVSKNPDVSVDYSGLLATTSAPRIEGTITNNSLFSLSNLELAVFVFDGRENVVAASRTFVDTLHIHSSQNFVFTWPKPFNLGTVVCGDAVPTASTTPVCTQQPDIITVIYRSL